MVSTVLAQCVFLLILFAMRPAEAALRVAVAGFPNNSPDPTISEIITSRIVNLLLTRGSGVQVIEREDLRRIIEEQRLNLTDLIDPDTSIGPGRIRGVDTIVMGKVLRFDIRTDVSTETRSATCEAGTRRSDNPQYLEKRRWVELLRRDVERLDQEYRAETRSGDLLSRILADPIKRQLDTKRSTLQTAELDLARTPPHVEERVHREEPYHVRVHTKRASFWLRVKMVHTETGRVLFDEPIQEQAEDVGEEVEAKPQCNLSRTILSLTSDDELKGRVVGQAMNRIGTGFQPVFAVLLGPAIPPTPEASAGVATGEPQSPIQPAPEPVKLVLFQDDFSSISAWEQKGFWEISMGKLRAAPSATSLLITKQAWDDYALELDFALGSAMISELHVLSVGLMVLDDANGYFLNLSLQPSGQGLMILSVKTEGKSRDLGRTRLQGFQRGLTYRLKFDKTGEAIHLKLWRRGELEPHTWQITAVNQDYSSGKIALIPGYLQEVFFEYLQVYR